MQNNQKIPEGWSVKKLGEISCLIAGNAFNSEDFIDMGIPLIRISNIADDGIVLDENTAFLPESFLKENSKFVIRQTDLLIAMSGATTGKMGINTFSEPMLLNQRVCIIRAKDVSQNFLNQYLFTHKKDILRQSYGGAQPNIGNNDIKKIKVLLPPLGEQEKIAGILGTWNEAIEKLSDLIEQKKFLKKGLMQKLLTGQTRLPGFSQPWKEVKLGEICKLEATTSKSAFIDENGKYYIIDMGAVSTEGTLISSKRTNTCEDLLKINDIVMPKDDIGGGNIIGKTAIIKQENTYILSDHVFKLNIHDSDSNFISYLINSYGYNKYMRRMSCGSAILGLSKKDVEKCLLNIPSDISEQQAIADVLSAADDEINLLNQKLKAIKEQKKGLMQQLLTGQIRVKVN